MPDKPRIAVLIPEVDVMGWQRFIVEEIIAGGEVEIALVIELCTSCDTPSGDPVWSVLDRMEALLSVRLFSRVHKAKGEYTSPASRPAPQRTWRLRSRACASKGGACRPGSAQA